MTPAHKTLWSIFLALCFDLAGVRFLGLVLDVDVRFFGINIKTFNRVLARQEMPFAVPLPNQSVSYAFCPFSVFRAVYAYD